MNTLALDTKKIVSPALSTIALRFLHTLVGALILTWVANAAAVSNSVTDIGTLGGTYSVAYGINDSGQVVGQAYTAGNASAHAFLYTPGSGMMDLGTLGGMYSIAYGINASGQVVGESGTAGDVSQHAFLYTPGSGMVDLGTLGGTSSIARGINASGQVVGYSNTTGNASTHAFLYTPGSGMVDLALGSTSSIAYGINDSGQVVGYSATAVNASYHAFLYTPGSGMADISSIIGAGSTAYGINNSGQVVGYVSNNGGWNAFLYTPGGGMMYVGPGGLNTEATGINASGQVVGNASSHAFLYTPGSGTVDLSTLGGPYSIAYGINAGGQVVGYSYTAGYQIHAFLYTPGMNNTIAISGGTTIEPWNQGRDPNHQQANLPYQAIVKDQNGQPKAGVEVTVTTDVTTNSGGHNHNDNRPKGKLAAPANAIGGIKVTGNTDSSGVFAFTFGAEEAAGEHTLTATCTGCPAPANATVNVMVDGLKPIPISPFYNLQLPNRDTNHPQTHFLMEAPRKKLETLAILYLLKTLNVRARGAPPDITLNDASLKWGGLLDCFLTCNSAQYPSTPWHEHHIEHRRGSVVDVKANGTPGSIVYEAKFREAALREGVDIGRPHGSGSGLHYHIRLNNNARE